MPRRRRRRSRSTSESRRSATSLRKLRHARRQECNHRRARRAGGWHTAGHARHHWPGLAATRWLSARDHCGAEPATVVATRFVPAHGLPTISQLAPAQGSAYDCYNAVEPAAAIGATSYAVDAVCARRSGRTCLHPRHVARQGATGSHAHGTYGTTQAASAGVGPDKRGKWLPDIALGACHSSGRHVHHAWCGHSV